MMVARFHVKASGHTAYQSAFDQAYKSEEAPFGEAMMFKLPAPADGRLRLGEKANQADTR